MTLFYSSRKMLAAAMAVSTLSLMLAAAPTMAQEPKLLTMAIPGNAALDNLDPRVLLTANHQAVQTAIFEPLVRSRNSDILPGMAETWEISADGKTYTFHLREAKWSDGKPVTGGDYVHAFDRMFTMSAASQIYDDILNGAELRAGTKTVADLGVKAPDEHTVVITLKNPTPYFLGLISSAYASPGRADLVEKYGDAYGASVESMAYNGPFILESWENENQLVLKKNPDYWNADAINLDAVDFLLIPDFKTQRNMFDNDELDIYLPVTEGEAKQYEEQGKLIRYSKGGVKNLTFNRFGQGDAVKAEILSDANFTKAISYAVDRQAFVDAVLDGNGIPATVQTPAATAVYPGTTWGEVSPNIGKFHPVAADLAKSAEYLQKAVADAGLASVADMPTFDLLTNETPDDPKTTTPYVLSVLTEMGLKVNLVQTTGNQYWNTLLEPALGFDIAVSGWGPDFNDPATYMGYWSSSSTDMGATFDNADFDALLAKANAETDLKQRATILGEAEALFSDIGPAVPLFHYKGTVAVQPSVKGLTTAIFGVPLNFLNVDIQK